MSIHEVRHCVYGRQRSAFLAMKTNNRRTVSAVIRAYNEAQHIGRLLEGLEQQTVKPDEVVLVDSGSTDDTVAIAEVAGCKVVHIPKSEFSFGRALNMGCAAASGDILLFASAHVYPVYDTHVDTSPAPSIEMVSPSPTADRSATSVRSSLNLGSC